MGDNKIKVLYIAGWGRSGSTILGNILGNINGFFHVGELMSLWDRGLIENQLCGCGVPFRSCAVWETILNKAYGDINHIDLYEMFRLRQNCARSRHAPLMLTSWGKSMLQPHLDKYLDNLERLYQAIQVSTGSKVIVDSSKMPSYGYALKMIRTIDLYVVHLIRDPRATAYSWLRKKFNPSTGKLMARYSPIKNAFFWTTFNLFTGLMWRNGNQTHKYIRVHYEDFVARPRAVISDIVQFVGEDASELPFISDSQVRVERTHAISGNPVKFQQGMIKVRPDTEWRSRMKARDSLLVTLLTLPLLIRYKYPVKATSHERE